MKGMLMRSRFVELLIVCVLVQIVAVSCTYLVIDSEPPGATILSSTNAVGPWKEWRGEGSKSLTPARLLGIKSTYTFFRVEKEGYFPSRPQLAELYPFRKTALRFDLEQTPEFFAAQQRARGLVFYGGQWVDPRAKGLVQYNGEWMSPEEKFDRAQEAKGFVKYDGKWMTKAEKEVAFARDQAARGLVLYKNRWMSKSDYDRESQIDKKVDEVQKEKTASLMRASITGKLGGDRARVRVLNGTGEQIICLLSGPSSAQFASTAYESRSVDLLEGDYRIVILAQNVGVPFLVEESFKEGFFYSLTYQGLSLSAMEETTLSKEEIAKQFDLPKIEIPEINTTPTVALERRPPGEDTALSRDQQDRSAMREGTRRPRPPRGDRASSPSLERRMRNRPQMRAPEE
jgi:hypothetical protein